MKAKYLIIGILVVLLAFIVNKMMKFEQSIREERIVKVKVYDETKTLFNEVSAELLTQLSNTSQYHFTANGDYFKALTTVFQHDLKKEVWTEIFLKGVNIGVAVPGKFPAEFSLSFDEYLEWFTQIGQMNANVIRTYTILPPAFYDAFALYNLQHQNKILYLMQGIWAKIPEDNNYYNVRYSRQFQKEIIDVIDLIHGNAVIEEKPGHAGGVYVSDISKYVIGILLGREWEPMAVVKTNHSNKENHFSGKFINMNDGNPMEAWLAGMMDYCVLYETQTYKNQRPISFVNWLPLDPLNHICEFIESEKIREYDNDLESIDFYKFHSTEWFIPGIYAAYHAYPYYPDFIYMQKEYANARNKDGQKDNYYGYLLELKNHHKGMPLVIAEYGLPSSRGNSHETPLGLDQGGLSEAEQADLSIQLTKDILDSRCAGAIYFEWIDEWFKHNWLVMDFEQPYENRKLWHNMENPEQNFGIYAYESKTKVIDGITKDWTEKFSRKNKFSITADADASYCYLLTRIPDFDFKSQNMYIAIDVFDKAKGDHKLPFKSPEIENGIEFLVQLKDTKHAKILVDDQFSIYNDFQNDIIPVFASKENNNGIFIDQIMLSNRGKTTVFDSIVEPYKQNRSILTHGNSNDPKTSNADWFWNAKTKTVEMRLDWHLLNVSDPSGRYVLDDIENTKGIECAKTDGFNIYVFVTDKDNKLISSYPIKKPFFYTWETWEIPTYTKRLKPIYYSFKDYFSTLNPLPAVEKTTSNNAISYRITDFYENKESALSLVFNDAGYTQITNALPIVAKYYLNISFGIRNNVWSQNISNYADEGSFSIKRFGETEIADLISYNHEVSLFFPSIKSENALDLNSIEVMKKDLELKTRKKLQSFYFQSENQKIEHPDLLFRVNLDPANKANQVNKLDYKHLYSYRVTNDFPKQYQLDSILKNEVGKWMIFSYYHFFKEGSNENNLIESKKYKNTYSVTPYIFERQARLFRNSSYWIAPVSNIGKYLKEKEATKIVSTTYGDLIFLTLKNDLDSRIYNQPLTVEFTSAANKIKVTGSENDGVYNNRTGSIYLNIRPNQEIKIELLYE